MLHRIINDPESQGEGSSLVGAVNKALESLVANLAIEMQPRRFNILSSGVVDSATRDMMSDDESTDFFAGVAEGLPVGRVGQWTISPMPRYRSNRRVRNALQATGRGHAIPGTDAAFRVLVNTTNAQLLGKAVVWAAEDDHGGAFNITSGDQFRWKHLWPKVADWFGLEVGEPQPISLQSRLNEVSGESWRQPTV